MKNSFCIICLALVILGFSRLAEAQVAAWSEGGPKIIFNSETDPPGAKRKVIGSIQTTSARNLFSRVFVDEERAVYFGYDVVVEPVSNEKRYKLTFKPLSISPDSLFFSGTLSYSGGRILSVPNKQRNSKLTALALPKYPEPQIVDEGDTLAFDVLVNLQTGVKIVDLIKVLSANSPLPQTLSANVSSTAGNGSPGPGKDFTIDAVELKISSSKLLVNGQPITGEANNSRLSVTGALIWFYLPQRGRFVLSLTPREGLNFQKAGTVQGNKIRFSIGGSLYEWISGSPVVTSGDETWNLWVFEDKTYKSEVEPTNEFPYLMGAADRADFLLEKK